MSTEEQKRQMAAEDEEVRQRVGRIRHRILVLSGKGGVGKSTVAANLAVSLALKGRKVGLLDVDVHGPSIPHLLGLNGIPPETSAPGDGPALLEAVPAMDNLGVMSIGFLLQSRETAVIWRGPMKYNVIRQFLKDVRWGDLDYLVVDSPPGTGDEPLAIAQLLGPPSHAVIVTTPQELALTDVRKCVTFCRQVGVPIIGVVENMSGFVCPHCGKESPIFKTGGGRAMAEQMGVPFLGHLPLDLSVVDAGDDGTPYVQRYSDSAAARAFAAIVERIVAGIEG
ncbi:MAG: Mrp/NBP35 family ATP-binding protein [Planctomycetes bacterium]|nr:Mrp/NBP35 family ATP-binding protein [Planctomycetota bacterium]